MNECGNVMLKFGTDVHEVLPLFSDVKEDINKEECLMICGGPMTGNAMFSGDFVSSPTLGSVIALLCNSNGKRFPHCLGCGTCAKHCPVHLSPYEIKRTLETSVLVQWLRFLASTAGGTGLIPGQGTEILHVLQQKKKKKKAID